MSLMTRVGLLAGASALTLTGASFADSPTEAQNWEARVAELEAQVSQLQGDNWLTEQRSDEIKNLVQDVLADADTRASLLQSGMTAGYDKGFVIGSADGNFLLKINGFTQIRWVYNYQDEENALAGLSQDDYDQFLDAAAPDNWGSGAVAGTEAVWGGYSVDYQYPIIGGDNFYGGVFGSAAFTAAQTTALEGLLDSAITSVGAVNPGAGAVAAKLTQVLDYDGDVSGAARDYLDAAFLAMTEVQRDAVITGFGMLDEAGDAVTTWSGFQALTARHATAWYAANANNRDNHRSGFEARRTRLSFSGHIIDPTWTYKIYGDFGRTDGVFDLLESWIAKDLGNGWSVKFGQASLPFLREWLVGATKQLAAERSLLNSYYTLNRSQGIWLDYLGDQIHFTTSFSDGAGNRNTGWNNEDVEFALASRLEWMWAGNWSQFKDFTSPRGSEYAGMLGIALHYEQEEFGTGVPDLHPWDGASNATANADETEQFDLTVDCSMEFDGANLYAAFIYQSWDSEVAGDFDRYGFLIQGGYYFTDDFEGFVRYEWADFDMMDLYWPVTGEEAYSFDDLSVLTFGFNKYFAGHNIKWTTDLGYAFDRVEFFAADAGAGYESDTAGGDGQVVFRSQLQLAF